MEQLTRVAHSRQSVSVGGEFVAILDEASSERDTWAENDLSNRARQLRSPTDWPQAGLSSRSISQNCVAKIMACVTERSFLMPQLVQLFCTDVPLGP